jgi:hypothetical protein
VIDGRVILTFLQRLLSTLKGPDCVIDKQPTLDNWLLVSDDECLMLKKITILVPFMYGIRHSAVQRTMFVVTLLYSASVCGLVSLTCYNVINCFECVHCCDHVRPAI